MSYAAAVWDPDNAAIGSWIGGSPTDVEIRRPLDDQGRYTGSDTIGVLLTWGSGGCEASSLAALGGRVWAWRVEPHHVKRGEAAIRMVALARRRPDITHGEFVERWTMGHAPLALRHHVGLAAYTQHVVAEPLTDASEVVDAIAELGFATREDFETRFYDSDAGRDVVASDVGRFMAGPGPDTTLMEPTRR